MMLEGPRPRKIKARVLLAMLLVVFPVLVLLVREQGRVIDAQRLLIQQLFGDSQELNAMRVRDLNNRRPQATPAPAPQAPADTPQAGAGTKPERNKRQQDQARKPALPPAQEYPVSRPTQLFKRKAV